jgi:tagaturonate reductase
MMIKDFFVRFNTLLEKGMPLLTPCGVVIGFVLGDRIAGFTTAVTVFFAFMTFSGALGMNVRNFVDVVKKPLPIFVFLFCFHIVIPIVIRIIAGAVFRTEPAFVTGLVLLFAIPTAVAGYIWTSIHNGNGPLALTLILIDTVLAPLLTPFTVSFLLSESIQIDSTGMLISLVWMVVIPSIIGVCINELSRGKAPAVVTPYFKPLAKISLLLVVAINSARVSGSITSWEPVFLFLALICLGLTIIGFLIGRFAGGLLHLPRPDMITVTFATGLRNISAALVLALNFFEPRAALPVICGIVFQQTLAALMGKVLIPKRTNEIIELTRMKRTL